MASSPNANQSPAMRNSRRHAGVRPPYHRRTGSCQAIAAVSPLDAAAASLPRTAILGAA